MSQEQEEHRRYPRFELFCPIDLLNESGELIASAQTVNISNGGALMQIDKSAAPDIGSVFNIKTQVPSSPSGDGPMRELLCQAKVLRHEDDGMPGKINAAIEFLQPLPLDLDQ